MLNENSTIEVTIRVPIGDIEITNMVITHEKESRDCPESWDATYDCITVKGLNDSFEIVEYDDSDVDELALLRWNAGETE